MPGNVGQNDTDFTLLQEELNALIFGHCGLMLQLAPCLTNFGGTQPLSGRGRREREVGIDRPNCGLLACTRGKGVALKLGRYWS